MFLYEVSKRIIENAVEVSLSTVDGKVSLKSFLRYFVCCVSRQSNL